MRADVEVAGGADDRSVGTDGAAHAADFLAGRLASATGEPVHRQTFFIAIPVVDECAASEAEPKGDAWVQTDRKIPIAPLIPSGGQAAAIPPELSSEPLVYAGRGALDDFRGKDLRRRTVALDASSPATAWQTAASLGAAAILFIGDEATTNTDLLNKTTEIPIGIPRFYSDDPGEAQRIRAGQVAGISLRIRLHWEDRRADNLLCVLPARQRPASRGGSNDTASASQPIIVQARYDATSLVMGRAPGAAEAVNAALLLDLAEKLSAMPTRRTVVFALTAGDEWALRGSRELVDLIDRDARDTATAVAQLQARADRAADRAREADDTLAALQQVQEGKLAALGIARARPAIEEELLRKSSVVETDLQNSRTAGSAAPNTASFESQKEALLAAGAGLRAGTPPDAAGLAILKEAAREAATRWATQANRAHQLRDALRGYPELRSTLGDHPPLLWLSLALTSGNNHYGFFARSFLNTEADATGPMSGFGQAFRRYLAPEDLFQPDSLENRFTLETYFPVPRAFSSDAALARAQPAGAFATTQDATPLLDTPNDTPARINWPNVNAQADSLEHLLLGDGSGNPGVLTDPRFYARAELAPTADDQQVTLFEHTLGESLPQLHAGGALVGGRMEFNGHSLRPLVGTRRNDWHLADINGNVTFLAAARAPRLRTRLQAFEFDKHGLPLRALAGNLSDARGLVDAFEGNPDQPARAMLFDCKRLDAFALFDPRYLDTLDRIDLLDARRLDAPEFSNVYIAPDAGAFAAVFMPPDLRWQLLASRGNVSNRMILINADDKHPAGTGFSTTNLADIGPLQVRGALDFATLNAQRQRQLERFGVSNDVVTELQKLSAGKRDEIAQAEKTHDYPRLLAIADSLWALQSQVYQNLIDTSNGIIKAVIFLLLGLIPFSYFVERLAIGATNIYKQIAWFTAIFALMTLALWFHPAFRISSAPLMILLAFLIIILSSTVVYILWGKFEEEIARLRGAELGAHMTSLKRGAVVGAAIRLGLSNMRRRGTRTSLTLLTLVLLTFTLLCFTSVREAVYVAPQVILFPGKTPPPGILLRQRGWRTLPPETLQLAHHLADSAAPAIIAPRYWYSSDRAERPWFIPIQSDQSTSTMYVNALIGLDPNEQQFQATSITNVFPGFDELANHPDLCWLPATARDALPGLSVGDTVQILGRPLKVAGFFTPADLGRLRQLTADPITPIDPRPLLAGSTNPTDAATAPETSYRFLSPQSVAIIPAPLAQQLNARLTSVMILPASSSTTTPAASGGAGPSTPTSAPTSQPHPELSITNIAELLAKQSAFTLYVSDGHSVHAINASATFSPKDFGDVLIPMLIGGMIVFNTMLGAVSERGREIHVYTSVGLAPSHVGMLFLAEAAALGTIGVVAGYIFGQGFATVLSWTHWLPDVALNYSSVSAIVTMGMVLGVVMLSALWPARAATRVAAPSLQRDWKLPKPVGDLLAVDLPFTVNESAAKGVCAFVAEFLISTSQSGTGRFTADAVHAFTRQTTQGPVRGLSARIWLTPYDLGVIQTMNLSIHPTDQHNVFDVHVEMTREAGNPGTWRRLNRPFLIDIRKQFLLWRNLSHDLMQQYTDRSEKLFAKAHPPR